MILICFTVGFHHFCTIRGPECHFKQVYPAEFGRKFVDFHESYNFTKHFTTLILNDLMVLYGDQSINTSYQTITQ